MEGHFHITTWWGHSQPQLQLGPSVIKVPAYQLTRVR